MENSFEEGSVTIHYIAQRTNRETKVTQAAFSRSLESQFTLHSVGTSSVSQETIQSLHLHRWHNTLPLAHSQTTRTSESSTSPSAHLNPNVFWPPAQLSPSDGGDRLVARQCLSTAAAPKDTRQTGDRTQCSPSITGNITISPSFFTKGSADSKNFLQIKYRSISEGPLGIFQGVLLFHPSPPSPTSPILLYHAIRFPFLLTNQKKEKKKPRAHRKVSETPVKTRWDSHIADLLVVGLRVKFLVLLLALPDPCLNQHLYWSLGTCCTDPTFDRIALL